MIQTRLRLVSNYKENSLPDQITARDRRHLRAFAERSKCIVDIGTFTGASAECMLDAQPLDGRLYTIDTFNDSFMPYVGHVKGQDILESAQRRLARFGSRAEIIKSDSVSAAAKFQPHSVDLVFIDGAHDYGSVRADIEAWHPILRLDGVMAGHDFDKEVEGRSYASIEQFKTADIGPDNIHYGLIAAVMESFSQFSVSESKRSSIWWALPEWKSS